MPTDPVLAEIAAQAQRSGCLALDTEFMGEGRYRTLLCLIQLAVPDHTHGPAHRADRPAGRAPRRRRRSRACSPTPRSRWWCTPGARTSRCCAGVCRPRLATSSTRRSPRASRGWPRRPPTRRCSRSCSGVRVAKSASFTRWDERPLAREQLVYAREDVAASAGARRGAQAAARRPRAPGVGARGVPLRSSESSDERDEQAIFARLPRIRGLSAASQAIARELVDWRERTAAAQDRTVQSGARRRGAGRDRQAPPLAPRASSSRSAGSPRAACAAAARRCSTRCERGRAPARTA